MPAYLMHIYCMHAVFNKSTLINAFFSRSNKELIKRMLRSLVEKSRIEIVSFFFKETLKKLTILQWWQLLLQQGFLYVVN